MRRSVGILLAIAIVAIILELQGPIATVGGLASLIGVLCCLAALLIMGFGRPDVPQRAKSHGDGWVALVAVGLVVANLQMCTWALARARHLAKTAVVRADLSGLGYAIKMYHDDHGDYPRSLLCLVTGNYCTTRQLRSVFDSYATPERIADGYRSFIYQPGVGARRDDPDLILAYERMPWSAGEAGGQWVSYVTANWETHVLEVDEFLAAEERDTRRRREIGWPVLEDWEARLGVTETQPAGE